MRRSEEELKLIRDWLAFARENLLAAKALVDEDFTPFHTVCFMCQGSAEKHLKAYLLYHGWQLKKTHDLTELLKLCFNFDDRFQGLLAECELLNEYTTEGRYPGDLPFESIGREDAEEAIEAAERIAEFVLSRLQL